MDANTWFIIGACAIALIAVVVMIIVILKNSINHDKKVDGVKIINGVRYTKDSEVIDEQNDVNVTHKIGDVILERGKEYVCKKNGKLIPGKYTVLSADENSNKFYIRVDGLVREYKHFSSLVLAENDTICAVSHSIILR